MWLRPKSLATFDKKWNKMLLKGAFKGMVFPYDDELLKRLGHVYYGGIPASILLLVPSMCSGYCYDRSVLITLGMDDFRIVNGAINSLLVKYADEVAKDGVSVANHSWVESNGWVYDTTLGLKIKKELYYAMEDPIIRKINTKEDALDFFEYQSILNADIENDKYALPLTMPIIEDLPPHPLYADFFKQEIARFKTEVDYDAICQVICGGPPPKPFEVSSEHKMN